ncbi:hypothetical protein SNL152K_9911 [Streptomyces sp. NL15-2K]|nr:hypothetical protein SNL152K_9911 [Streptomyces sp. NL15-2K]
MCSVSTSTAASNRGAAAGIGAGRSGGRQGAAGGPVDQGGRTAETRRPLDAGLRLERRGYQPMFGTADFREGVKAFVDKRTPEFTAD